MKLCVDVVVFNLFLDIKCPLFCLLGYKTKEYYHKFDKYKRIFCHVIQPTGLTIRRAWNLICP